MEAGLREKFTKKNTILIGNIFKAAEEKMKKNYIIIMIIALVAIVFIGKTIVNNFQNDRYYSTLLRIGIIKKCEDPGHFLDVFYQEGLDYEVENEEVIFSSLAKLSNKNIQDGVKLKIPAITHRIYFVPESRTSELELFYIEQMRINFNKLNDLGEDWQHNIWINKPELISQDIYNIKGVQVRSLSELEDHPLYFKLLDLLKQGDEKRSYLAEASDLLRLMLLQKFGGIYADMDYEIYNPSELLDLMKRFDFIGGREHVGVRSYYGNAFMAAKPEHPILNEAIRLSLRNRTKDLSDPKLPYYIKYPCRSSDELYFNGPPLITISYFKKNNIDLNNDIILPPWMIFNGNFARYKNKTCSIERMTKKLMDRNNKNIDELLNNFIVNPLIKGAIIGDPSGNRDNTNYYGDHFTQGDIYSFENYKDYNNIYYSLEKRREYNVIGADMFCGSWTHGQVFRKIYYWNWPWSK